MKSCNKLSITENCVSLQGKNTLMEQNKNQNKLKK